LEEEPLDNLLLAFGLTLFAGLATGIGSILAFFHIYNEHKIFIVFSRLFSWGDDLCVHD
jgi:ZIP family zinc transporter